MRRSTLVVFVVAALAYLAAIGVHLEVLFGAAGCLLLMIAGLLLVVSAKTAARSFVPPAVVLLALSAFWPVALEAARTATGPLIRGHTRWGPLEGGPTALVGTFVAILSGTALLWLFAVVWSRMPPRPPGQGPRLRERALVHRDLAGDRSPLDDGQDQWDLNLLLDDESP